MRRLFDRLFGPQPQRSPSLEFLNGEVKAWLDGLCEGFHGGKPWPETITHCPFCGARKPTEQERR